MGSFNVRKFSDKTHKALRIRAAQHGRSMEAEVRAILDDAVGPKIGLGSMLAEIGRDLAASISILREMVHLPNPQTSNDYSGYECLVRTIEGEWQSGCRVLA